jgi:hypothetical protein
MRRAGIVGTASVVLLGAVFGFAVTVAVAAPLPPDVGWWWVGRAGGPVPMQIDPAPEVPEDGFYVAADPSGPSAVSAIRIRLEPDAADPVLTIDVSDTIGTPALDACVATEAWTPVDGGVWDQRPPSDCTQKVPGAVSADGSKVSFALSPLVDDGSIDVVLVPAAPAEGTPAVFSTAFAPLADDALSTASPSTYQEPAPDDSFTAGDDPSYVPDYTSEGGYSAALLSDVEPLPEVAASPGASVAPRTQRRPMAAVALTSPQGFQYAVILVLPLLLIVGCAYVGWALTRPIDVVAARVRDARS